MMVFSERLGQALFLGRQPQDRTLPRVELRMLPDAALTPPPAIDWQAPVPSWNMALNDQIGDCTCAGMGHIITLVEQVARQNAVTVPDNMTLAMYEAISGYVPGNPATDVGATLQSALDYARQMGLDGFKPVAFAQIDVTNLALVRNCIDLFGCVYTGFNFPTSAMQQFDAHQPWSVVQFSAIEGGHCVPVGAYDSTGFGCVTWGTTQRMTTQFFQRYFDEAWVAIFPDWLETTGKTPTGLDGASANADYQALTGDTASPFPVAPAPTPTPAPTPGPSPSPDNNPDDNALASAMHAWLTAKGL